MQQQIGNLQGTVGFQCHENDNKLFFLLLNLTVPWGLLTTSATTNLTSAGHGAISGHESDSNPGLQSDPGHPRPQNGQI